MDSNLSSSSQENNEPKAEFRKLTNEATNRKYRRHSSASGSSDEDGSPNRDHISRGISKTSSHERRNYDKVDGRSFGRSQHGRNNDSYRYSSRGSRHDEPSRYRKYADEDDNNCSKPSDRSGRESRGGAKSDYRDRESDYNRSRDHYRDVDRYPRDRSDRTRYDGRHGARYDDRDRHLRDKDHQDERREYKSSRDHRGDRTMPYEDFKGHKSDPSSKKEIGDVKDLDGLKYNQGKSKTDGPEEVPAKRSKFSLGGESGKDEKLSSASMQRDDLPAKVSPDQGPVSGAGSVFSVNDAAVRAIKAAQSVNQDLSSAGLMTAINPKKKLLWGDKKIKATEESSNHWDAAHFTDRERQEKFYKLMGVKGEVKVESKPLSSQDAEKQREVQLELEKQYTAGLRRRDGRTVGLGL